MNWVKKIFGFYSSGREKKKNLILFLILGAVIAVLFALPDLYVDYKTGNMTDPIRYFQGNNAHYLTILNAARHSNQTVPNSYLHEQQSVPSHYALLQLIAAYFPFFDQLSIAWTWTLLRILVALSYFFILYLILRDIGVNSFVAQAISFGTVTIWGYIRFQSMALGNWYLPFMILGMYLGVRAMREGLTPQKRFLLLSASLLLYSWHAVSFSLGGLAVLLIWFYLIYKAGQKNRRDLVLSFLAWSFLSLLLFAWLYAPFMFSQSDTAVSTLSRVVQFSSTYLMYHPIETIVVLVSVMTLFLTRRYGYAFFGVAAIVGLNSNLITGFYFANDHYVVLTEALAVAAAASLWLAQRDKPWTKWLGFLALVAGLWYLAAGLSHLAFRPAYVGRYMVVTLGMLMTSLIIFWPTVRNFFQRYRLVFLVLIICLSTLYTAGLAYKGTAYPLQAQEEKKAIVPLLNYLKNREYGVVLANSKLSNDIALFTQDRIYWSELLFTDLIADDEILHRWLVSRIFFPNDEQANGELAVDAVYGAEIRCRHFQLFAKPLLGPFQDSFISRLREKDCPRIAEARQQQKKFLDQTLADYQKELKKNKFTPAHRLDFLVVSPEDQTPKDILKRDFNFVVKTGEFSIYELKK